MKFSELFLELLRVQLTLKGVIKESEWGEIEDKLGFHFAKDSHFTELKESEILKDRLQTVRDAEDFIGKYYSREWIRKKILRQTEDDVEQINKQIAAEQAAGIIASPDSVTGGVTPEIPQNQPITTQNSSFENSPQVMIGEIVPSEDEDLND